MHNSRRESVGFEAVCAYISPCLQTAVADYLQRARELTLLHNRPLSAQINRLALDDAGEETRAPT